MRARTRTSCFIRLKAREPLLRRHQKPIFFHLLHKIKGRRESMNSYLTNSRTWPKRTAHIHCNNWKTVTVVCSYRIFRLLVHAWYFIHPHWDTPNMPRKKDCSNRCCKRYIPPYYPPRDLKQVRPAAKAAWKFRVTSRRIFHSAKAQHSVMTAVNFRAPGIYDIPQNVNIRAF